MFKALTNYNQVFSLLVGTTLLLLSLPGKPAMIGIVFIALHIIYGYKTKKISFQFNKTTAILVALYIAYAIGLLFSEIPSESVKTLEYKLSLLLLPILLMIQLKGKLNFQIIFSLFIIGVLIGSFFGIVNGYICYKNTGDINCMMSTLISPIVHPTYFSAYVFIAIAMLWLAYKRTYKFFTLPIVSLLTIYFLMYTVLMKSLAGMLFFALIFILFLGVLLYSKWGLKSLFAMLLFTPLFFFGTYNFIPQVKSEVEDLQYYLKGYVDNSENYFETLYYPYSGTQARLIMWRLSARQIAEQPLGVGTGDSDLVLESQMQKHGLHQEFIDKHLNPHNQYLQTTIEIGLVGLLILLTFIATVLLKSSRQRDILLLLLALNFAFNCMFESIIQRQDGIIFYTFLFCILMIPSKKTESNNEQA